MSFDVDLTITGIQEAQQANLRAIHAALPERGLGRVVGIAALELHRYATAVTHVDTGALRASHRIRQDGSRAEIYIDPGSVNPRTGEHPAQYGIEEHDRGGLHAFYLRTFTERGPEAVSRAGAMLRSMVD